MTELMLSNRTVLIVSHATDTLKKFCNRIIWINDGSLVEIGDTDAVLKRYDEFMNL